EMTWPMRLAGMYMAPYRLKHRKPGNRERNYGPEITPGTLQLEDGPITGGQSPGSITRWMAIPWQTDTASCRSGYDPTYDPYLPTFWPARVPNEVMGEEAYQIVMDQSLPMSQRLQAFANRADWNAPLGSVEKKSYTHQINHMIHHFEEMGVVETRPGPDDPAFPAVMQISDQQQTPWKAPNVESVQADPRVTRQTLQRADSPAEVDPDTIPADFTRIDKARRFKSV
ncbi:MAG: LodA/GoxA family CTQ-dependent oxidase, partial [Pseudomonadota bacterium]